MKLDKKSMFVLVLILLVGISLSYVSNTYAKYTGTVSGSATATVAEWAFSKDNESSILTVALDKNYDASTLVNGKIAPGTSGSFAIKIVNTNTETGVNYTLAIGDKTNVPSNLKFYTDAEHKSEVTDTNKITGTLAPNDSTGVNVTLYWAWEYETTNGDADDTTDGENALTMTIPVTITGVQSTPTEKTEAGS